MRDIREKEDFFECCCCCWYDELLILVLLSLPLFAVIEAPFFAMNALNELTGLLEETIPSLKPFVLADI
jgi:hypothetical protein